jgi:hypothetical protein
LEIPNACLSTLELLEDGRRVGKEVFEDEDFELWGGYVRG